MPHKSSAGTYMLTADHTEALARLASDPDIAGMIGPSTAEFITRLLAARAEGTGHGFVVVDGGEVMGLSTLHDVGHVDGAEVGVWIDRTQRGKGYATFAVGMMLHLAFRNLGQSRVRASVPEGNPGARRVFEKNGFVRRTEQPDGTLVHEVTRQESAEFRNRPALAALHPSLRTILDAEIAAGNEVVETGGGWPDPDSALCGFGISSGPEPHLSRTVSPTASLTIPIGGEPITPLALPVTSLPAENRRVGERNGECEMRNA